MRESEKRHMKPLGPRTKAKLVAATQYPATHPLVATLERARRHRGVTKTRLAEIAAAGRQTWWTDLTEHGAIFNANIYRLHSIAEHLGYEIRLVKKEEHTS